MAQDLRLVMARYAYDYEGDLERTVMYLLDWAEEHWAEEYVESADTYPTSTETQEEVSNG